MIFCFANRGSGTRESPALTITMRQILLHRDEDGFWVAECPSLPGCATQGKSKDEAIENIKEAIDGYLDVLKGDGKPIPDDPFDYQLIAL